MLYVLLVLISINSRILLAVILHIFGLAAATLPATATRPTLVIAVIVSRPRTGARPGVTGTGLATTARPTLNIAFVVSGLRP